jgi:hypothetical protein
MLSSRPFIEDTALSVGVWLTDPPGGVARILRAREIDIAVANYFLEDAVRAFRVAVDHRPRPRPSRKSAWSRRATASFATL